MPLSGYEISHPSTTDRYKCIFVHAPQLAVDYFWPLKALEEFHQEGWHNCGMLVAENGLYLYYERRSGD